MLGKDKRNEVLSHSFLLLIAALVVVALVGTAVADPAPASAQAVEDFGDAPDPLEATSGKYPTLLANDGARHALTGPILGTHRDGEVDGLQSALADGDDNDGNPDDEDGVTLSNITPSADSTTEGSVSVKLQNADPTQNLLNAWIDFNADGDWDDAGEQIFDDYPLGTSNSTQMPTYTVPQDTGPNIVQGTTFARFRLDTAGGLDPTGAASDGEVEDHTVVIEGTVAVSLSNFSAQNASQPWFIAAAASVLIGLLGMIAVSRKLKEQKTEN